MIENHVKVQSFPNVYRTSWGNRWFVQMTIDGQRKYLGTYETPELAYEVVKQVGTKSVGTKSVGTSLLSNPN